MYAGHEPEVFESPDDVDGRPVFEEPAAGANARAQAIAAVDVGDVIEHTISARESFETFMGRRYDPSERLFDVDAVLGQQPLLPSSEQFDALARHLTRALEQGLESGRPGLPPHRKLETPLLRYTRLLQEVAALQSELRGVEASDARRAPGTTVVDHASGVFRVIDSGTAVVQQQLERLLVQVQQAALAAPAAAVSVDAVSRPAPASHRAAIRQVRDQFAVLCDAQQQLAAATQTVTAALAAMHRRLDMLTLGEEGE